MSFEDSLSQHEAVVDDLLKSIAKYVSAVKAWKKACQNGSVLNIQKASKLADDLSLALPNQTRNARETWEFDVRAYLEGTEWVEELQEAATNKHGLRTIQDNGTLISSPVIVRSSAARSILFLGKSNWSKLRPRLVADQLKRLRDRTLSASSNEFLECVYAATERLAGENETFARFRDIYDLFCLSAGYKKECPTSVFAQQIYSLQRSGLK